MRQSYILKCRLPRAKVKIPIYLAHSPILRGRAAEVTADDLLHSGDVATCLHRMECVMRATTTGSRRGRIVGLAAPQLGFPYRIIAFRDMSNDSLWLVGNPTARLLTKDCSPIVEGCLSSPGIRQEVSRVQHIHLVGINVLDLSQVSTQFKGKTAAIIQHEIDHLEGRSIELVV